MVVWLEVLGQTAGHADHKACCADWDEDACLTPSQHISFGHSNLLWKSPLLITKMGTQNEFPGVPRTEVLCGNSTDMSRTFPANTDLGLWGPYSQGLRANEVDMLGYMSHVTQTNLLGVHKLYQVLFVQGLRIPLLPWAST